MVGKELIDYLINQIGIKLKSDYVQKEIGKGLSDNNYTTLEKDKLANLYNYDDTALYNQINTKANITDVYNKNDINSLMNNKVDKETGKVLISMSDLDQIGINNQNIQLCSLITETGSQIMLNIDNTNYKMSASLKDKNGNIIYTSNVIDLPLETMLVNATYNNSTKQIILTLQNGNTISFSVADLVSGLVNESDLTTGLNTKVDKIIGKGLSTNDFTTAEKNKLAGLNNYDDTAINAKIPDMTENEIDVLVGTYYGEV